MAGAIHSSFIVPHSLFARRYSLFAVHWSSFAGRWSVAARKLGNHHSHEPSDERNANSDPRSSNRDAYVIDQSRPANPHGAGEEEGAVEIDGRRAQDVGANWHVMMPGRRSAKHRQIVRVRGNYDMAGARQEAHSGWA